MWNNSTQPFPAGCCYSSILVARLFWDYASLVILSRGKKIKKENNYSKVVAMTCSLPRCIKSSIGKKQVVATTGLMLVLFIIGHLAGNLIMYLGPGPFNKYAAKLADLRPWLYAIEVGLLVVFIIHMWLTITLVIENKIARPVGYEVR